MTRKKHKKDSILQVLSQVTVDLFRALLTLSVIRQISSWIIVSNSEIVDVKKTHKRKKKKKRDIEILDNLPSSLVTQESDNLVQLDVARVDDALVDLSIKQLANSGVVDLEHSSVQDVLFEVGFQLQEVPVDATSHEASSISPVIQTFSFDDASLKCCTDSASSISSISMGSDISPDLRLVPNTSDLVSSYFLSDREYSDETSCQSTSTFVECSSVFPRPLSYERYPFFEGATLKLVSILHRHGYPCFVFGGVIYRRYSKPGDIDIVIPNFMSVTALKTLETSSPDAVLFDNIKTLLGQLAAEGVNAIGFNEHLKIPGYQRENRYMLPLVFILADGTVMNADLTLFSENIERHAERDLSLSTLYYDPIYKKMYNHSSFSAIEDLNARLIRPILEPVSLIQGSPRLIFNFLKLHVTEGMMFDSTLFSAFHTLGQLQPNVFLKLSDKSLQNELIHLTVLLQHRHQFCLFFSLGLFGALYERLQLRRLDKLVSYGMDMADFQIEIQYQRQYYYAIATQQAQFYAQYFQGVYSNSTQPRIYEGASSKSPPKERKKINNRSHYEHSMFNQKVESRSPNTHPFQESKDSAKKVYVSAVSSSICSTIR